MSQAKRYRYPGVMPFSESDRDIFFGRDADAEQLHDLLLLEKMVVLFGKSGYGKSSLLNAGLIPLLHDPGQNGQFRYLPVPVRLYPYSEGSTPTPAETTRLKLQQTVAQDADSTFLRRLDLPPSLWLHCKRLQAHTEGHIVLIFDQFEEFFSYPAEQQAEFRRQLAEMLYTAIPQPVRSRMGELPASERSLLVAPMDNKVLFSIRADRLSLLDSMKSDLPDILQRRYELRPLSPEQARIAMVRPAALAAPHFITEPFGYSDAAIQKIIRELSAEPGPPSAGAYAENAGVEAFQLQILCQYIENQVENGAIAHRNGDGLPSVEVNDLPDMSNLYESYYRRQIDRLDAPLRRPAQVLLEEGLLSEDPQTGEGRRMSVDSEFLKSQFRVNDVLLRALENTYLIRKEPNSVGGENMEISHDTLVMPMMKTKKERRAKEETEAAARREAELIKERRKRKRARWLAAMGFGLFLFTLVLLIIAVHQQNLLHETTGKVVESILKDAGDLTLRMQYDEAWNKMSDAAQLNEKKTTVAKALMEIAFFYGESGKWDKALPAAKQAVGLFGNKAALTEIEKINTGNPADARSLFRSILKSLDEGRYLELESRYYPQMIDVKGGPFRFQNKYNTEIEAFQMAKTETTFWQFGLYCTATGLNIKEFAPNWGASGDNPVVNITWYDAIEYANWVSQQLGKAIPYKIDKQTRDTNNYNAFDTRKWTVVRQADKDVYRLPTEIEWEYAARGGPLDLPYRYCGGDTLNAVGWYWKNSSERTQPVARKKPNELGLSDMSGNVWEWCWDWYGMYSVDSLQHISPPAEGKYRILRGGSYFSNNVNDCQVLNRNVNDSPNRSNKYGFTACGFRLVKTN